MRLADVGSWKEGGGHVLAQGDEAGKEAASAPASAPASGPGGADPAAGRPARPTGQGPPFPMGPGAPMMGPYRGMMPPPAAYVSRPLSDSSPLSDVALCALCGAEAGCRLLTKYILIALKADLPS